MTLPLRKTLAERTLLNLNDVELRWLAANYQLAWEHGPCMLGTLSIKRAVNIAAPGDHVRIVRYHKHPADPMSRRGIGNLADTVNVPTELMAVLATELEREKEANR